MKIVDKVWGKEYWVVNNELYCFKELHLKKDHFCSMHHHKVKDETFIVHSGLVSIVVNGIQKLLFPHDSIRIAPGMEHRFTGLEDSVIYEISTTHMDEDSYRSSPSGKL